MPAEQLDDRTSGNILQLNWHAENDRITVTPENHDRYSIRVRRAIELLQLAAQHEAVERQLDFLQKIIAEWIRQRENLRDAYLTLRDGVLCLVAVQSRPEYDPEFEDDLSKLDLYISRDSDFDLIKLGTLALPPVSDEALSQFLSPDFTLRYNRAEGERPHRAGQ